MSTKFEAIFNAALAKYTDQTKKDLRKLPLTSKIDACKSAESILNIFREQAKAFDDFRNDNRLIKCLNPVVDSLYALSTSPVLTTIVGLASPSKLVRFVAVFANPVVV
jgi:hypothetical protein